MERTLHYRRLNKQTLFRERSVKKAKKEVGHKRTEREESKDEVIIWLDSEDGTPMGAIVKKKRSKNV